jgi:hypothetical protein
MAAEMTSQSSAVQSFDPDDFANASTIASWLESQPENEKLQCVQDLKTP